MNSVTSEIRVAWRSFAVASAWIRLSGESTPTASILECRCHQIRGFNRVFLVDDTAEITWTADATQALLAAKGAPAFAICRRSRRCSSRKD